MVQIMFVIIIIIIITTADVTMVPEMNIMNLKSSSKEIIKLMKKT